MSLQMHLCFSSDVEGKAQSTDHSYVYPDRRKLKKTREGRGHVSTIYDLISISTIERCAVKHQACGRAEGLYGFDV